MDMQASVEQIKGWIEKARSTQHTFQFEDIAFVTVNQLQLTQLDEPVDKQVYVMVDLAFNDTIDADYIGHLIYQFCVEHGYTIPNSLNTLKQMIQATIQLSTKPHRHYHDFGLELVSIKPVLDNIDKLQWK